MKRLIPLALLAIGGCYVPPPVPKARQAWPVKGQSYDQQHYSMLDLLRKGPVLLVFLDRTGSVSKECTQVFQLIANGYAGHASVLGLMNTVPEDISAFAAERLIKFPIVPDPYLANAKHYGVTRAPSAVLVGWNAEIKQKWQGYSARYIEEILDALARESKSPRAKVSSAGVPEAVQNDGELKPAGRSAL